MHEFAPLVDAVQRNCDISDARHAGDYGLCTFLLKMREFYRWENELSFAGTLPREELGAWLSAREESWTAIETEGFSALPVHGGIDPFDVEAANRELLPQGYVYSAGYGRLRKPVFFLGRLRRVEERGGFNILVSSCEYARELAAPPAMLLGRTIFLREESARRYLWEKVEEWKWNKPDNAMARALAAYRFMSDADSALERMADNEMEAMILHEIGEAMAGELLGEAWHEMLGRVARTPAESVARAMRDLLADCLSTLPALIESENVPALHFYFAGFDDMRRQLFPQAVLAYDRFLVHADLGRLAEVVREGARLWLEAAREVLARHESDAEGCGAALQAMMERGIAMRA